VEPALYRHSVPISTRRGSERFIGREIRSIASMATMDTMADTASPAPAAQEGKRKAVSADNK